MLPNLMDPVSIILLVVLGLLLYKSWSKPARFPPGPPLLPLVGNIPFMPKVGEVMETVRKYGKIVGMYNGPIPTVFIYDFKVAKKLLSTDVFSGRPDTFNVRERSFYKRFGLLFSEGQEWQEQRRFALKTLRDFGFGKKGLEGVLHEEIEGLVDYISKNSSQPITVQNLVNIAIINVLWTMVANKRFKLDDPKVKEIMKILTAIIQMEKSEIVVSRPWTRFFIPEKWSGRKKRIAIQQKICSELRDTIKEHRESYQEDNMRDFMDVYLREIQKNEKKSFHEDQMIIVCLDLFIAGAETTSTTLTWAFLYMILNPDVQQRVQKEIDEVIGQNRRPATEDRGKLPYTEATILEIQRLGSIVPNSLPHRTLTETEVEGYLLPKHTTIHCSLYYMSRDPDYWNDPETFNPERFLDDQGKVIKADALIPFGIGKRQCLGESLAKMELFFFFTGLLQHFTFSVCKDDPTPALTGTRGSIHGPYPYRVMAKPRF